MSAPAPASTPIDSDSDLEIVEIQRDEITGYLPSAPQGKSSAGDAELQQLREEIAALRSFKDELHEYQIRFMHYLMSADFSNAKKQLEKIVQINPNFLASSTLVEQIVSNYTLVNVDVQSLMRGKQGMEGGDDASHSTNINQNERILEWLLNEKFAVGNAVNIFVKRFLKLQFSQPANPTYPTEVRGFDNLANYHAMFDKLMAHTPLANFDVTLLTHLYDFSPIVLERLIGVGLDVSQVVSEHPIAWHVMRVAARDYIIVGSAANPIGGTAPSFAVQYYRKLKNCGQYRALPEYFEGCCDPLIIVDLLENRDFLDAVKKPVAALGDRYLSETITDDRIHGQLRERGVPHPNAPLFDAGIMDKEAPLVAILEKRSLELTSRNVQDLTLLGFSLTHGPYTSSHLACLRMIQKKLGKVAFSASYCSDTIPAPQRLNWLPLHIAMSKMSLSAWINHVKLREEDERNKQLAKARGTSAALEPKPKPVIVESFDHLPSKNFSAQVEIIRWLYENGASSFQRDAYGRTPLMCLPTSVEWQTLEGEIAFNQILREFVPHELALMDRLYDYKITSPIFIDRLQALRKVEIARKRIIHEKVEMLSDFATVKRHFEQFIEKPIVR